MANFRMPDYTKEAVRFTTAFRECISEGVYPAPTILNVKMGNPKKNTLNGRLSRFRIYLMHSYDIPMQRDSPYGKKGEIPINPYLPFSYPPYSLPIYVKVKDEV